MAKSRELEAAEAEQNQFAEAVSKSRMVDAQFAEEPEELKSFRKGWAAAA